MRTSSGTKGYHQNQIDREVPNIDFPIAHGMGCFSLATSVTLEGAGSVRVPLKPAI